jgi:hypothetical protein
LFLAIILSESVSGVGEKAEAPPRHRRAVGGGEQGRRARAVAAAATSAAAMGMGRGGGERGGCGASSAAASQTWRHGHDGSVLGGNDNDDDDDDDEGDDDGSGHDSLARSLDGSLDDMAGALMGGAEAIGHTLEDAHQLLDALIVALGGALRLTVATIGHAREAANSAAAAAAAVRADLARACDALLVNALLARSL